MAKLANWITPAAALADSFPAGLKELAPRAQVSLRGNIDDKAFVDAVKTVAGVTLPKKANKVATGDKMKALWLSPDEWLLVGEEATQDALVAALEEALAGQHIAVNDVSANRTIFALEGLHARDALMKSCALDFHPGNFTAGDCAQTVIGKSPAIIEQVSLTDYHLYIRGSLSRYVGGWLAEALKEYSEK
ncbi:MAG: hypothetical protein EP348_08500 [Alphaproteobacteria bacterium]|nr:MAG: hypothetical protein EP348_08500 [Alphaproteobacteria bacterium]